MDWLVKVIKVLQLPSKNIAISVFFISGLLLIIPEKIIEILRLSVLISKYGGYFGIFFLFSSVYTILFLFIPCFFKYSITTVRKIKKKLFCKISLKKNLNQLTYSEKCLLREFKLQNKSVLEVPIGNTEVISLLNKEIIERAAEYYNMYFSECYVFVKINKNLEKKFINDVNGFKDCNITPEVEIIKIQDRPKYLKDLEFFNKPINDL